MKKKALSLLLAGTLILGLTACGGPKIEVPATPAPAESSAPVESTAPAAPKELEFKAGTVLRMATGYNNAKTGLFFDPEVAGEGVTLADGNTYHAGDLKPTWVEIQNELDQR